MTCTRCRALPVLAVAAIAWGCHRSAALPLNPAAEVAITVDNQNYLDMDVFVLRDGQRVRIGTVPGVSSQVLMVRPDLVGYGTELRFELHPIGGRGNTFTETVTVRPGDVIHLTIPPS